MPDDKEVMDDTAANVPEPTIGGRSESRVGQVDTICAGVSRDGGCSCRLRGDQPAVSCLHPRSFPKHEACADLRMRESCPLVTHPVLLTAEEPENLMKHGQVLTGLPETHLMHCGKCGCNLGLTREDFATREQIVCPSCGHVAKNRPGKQA